MTGRTHTSHRDLVELSGDHDLPLQRVVWLASMFGVSAALCLLARLTGPIPSGDHSLLYGAAGVGAAAAAVLWFRRHRWSPPWYLQSALALYSLIVAAVAATADSVNTVTSLGPAVVMTCAYAGSFHSRATLYAQVSFAVGSYTLGAALSGPQTAWTAVLTADLAGVALAVVLRRLTTSLRERSLRDALTGAVSRTTWLKITDEVIRHGAGRRPISVAMVDLDEFKKINDTLGHAAGDQLLRELATAWQAALDDDGLLGRYGGDEFVVLFTGTDPERARQLLDRMKQAHPSSWTAGLATALPGQSPADLLQLADRDLRDRKALRTGPTP